MSSYRLMFPGFRSSLMFSGFALKPPASGFQFYFYSSFKTSPSVFEDNDLLFWVPDVLCQHSEVVLWNLLSIEMFFWWICEGETGLPVLFLCHLRNSLCLFFFKRTVTTFKNTNILLDFLWNQFSFFAINPHCAENYKLQVVISSYSVHQILERYIRFWRLSVAKFRFAINSLWRSN